MSKPYRSGSAGSRALDYSYAPAPFRYSDQALDEQPSLDEQSASGRTLSLRVTPEKLAVARGVEYLQRVISPGREVTDVETSELAKAAEQRLSSSSTIQKYSYKFP